MDTYQGCEDGLSCRGGSCLPGRIGHDENDPHNGYDCQSRVELVLGVL